MAYDIVPKGADEYLVDKTLSPWSTAHNYGIGGIWINGAVRRIMQRATWIFVSLGHSRQSDAANVPWSRLAPTRRGFRCYNDPELIAPLGTPYPAGSATGRTGRTTIPEHHGLPVRLCAR